MTLKEYLDVIIKFIRDYCKKSGCTNLVLGLSGGVDSSLVASLAKKAVGKEHLMCIMMPIQSNKDDLADAIKVAEALDVNYLILDAEKAYLEMKKMFINSGNELSKGSESNLKVRLRMSMLYAYGQNNNALVIGTDNMDERYTGYFTKYGDGAADLLPIVYLTKGEVVEAAKIMGVPSSLAERIPSAGLFDGQTDEKEMGVPYSILDSYLLGNKNIDQTYKDRIEYLHRISEHKRSFIPTPEEFVR